MLRQVNVLKDGLNLFFRGRKLGGLLATLVTSSLLFSVVAAQADEPDEGTNQAPATVTTSLTVDRFGGADRYGTNAAVTNHMNRTGGPVFVATGATFADALSVGPAVAKREGTLILTSSKRMAPETVAQVRSLAPSEIFLVGGTGAVSKQVEKTMQGIASTSRIGGQDRYETSKNILETFFNGTQSTVFVATGQDYPDALSASAAGGALDAPVLLVRGSANSLGNASTVIASTEADEVLVVGGTGVVSKAISQELLRTPSLGSIDRLSGSDRYGTNLAVNRFLDDRLDSPALSDVWVATGANFPDALSAAVPAGAPSQRLVLSKASCLPTTQIGDWKDSGRLNSGTIHLVGGQGVLAPSVADLSECYARPTQTGDIVLPEPTVAVSIAIDTLGQPLPSTKGEGALPVEIVLGADGVAERVYATIKVQGSSTAKWPKKNWNLRFFADEARTIKRPLKVGDSVASTTWIAKAEWIDPSQMRNPLSYRLWEDMTVSRDTFPQREVDQSNYQVEGAIGYPNTYIGQVTANGEHYGIATLTMGRDPQNYNIEPGNPDHSFFEFDGRGGQPPVKDWVKYASWGVNLHFESYLTSDGTLTAAELERIDELGQILNGPIEDFADQFDTHLDKNNMIDMLLFIEMIDDWDGVAQDLHMVSYDGTKWFMLPWDKDTTFGLAATKEGVLEGSEYRIVIDKEEEQASQKPWFKTYHTFLPDVEARYAYLRDSGVFSIENVQNHLSDLRSRIPEESWAAERSKWDPLGRTSAEEAGATQLLSWFEIRLQTLDAHFNYNQNTGELLDESPEEPLEQNLEELLNQSQS